jgi:hypothetical protein
MAYPVLSIRTIIKAVDSVLVKSARARGAKKLDESRQRDAQAHSANEQLKDVDSMERGERGPLRQIE